MGINNNRKLNEKEYKMQIFYIYFTKKFIIKYKNEFKFLINLQNFFKKQQIE
jgi:hypothetical protein